MAGNGQPDNEHDTPPSNASTNGRRLDDQQQKGQFWLLQHPRSGPKKGASGVRPSSTPEAQEVYTRKLNTSSDFALGIAIGCIPLFLFLAATAANRSGYSSLSYTIIATLASVIAYVIVLIASIVSLSIARQRFIGYGLLTMVLVAPIISAIGCMVATRV